MGSTQLTIAAVQLCGLHVGLKATLHTVVKSGKKQGQPKAIVVPRIVKVEHDGKQVRVFAPPRRAPDYWYSPVEVSNVLAFDTLVTLEVPDGK